MDHYCTDFNQYRRYVFRGFLEVRHAEYEGGEGRWDKWHEVYAYAGL